MAYPATTTLPRTVASAPALRAVGGTGRDFASRASDAGVSLTGPLSLGPLVVDLAGYVVTLSGEELDVSPRQVRIGDHDLRRAG